MSRIRKLSEGADLAFSRLKHRQSSKSIHTTSKKPVKLGSPYSKIKLIARSPSYLLAQIPTQSKAQLSVRSKSKNSFRLEDSSLSAARLNTPWENLAIQARLFKDKLKSIEKQEQSPEFYEKVFELFDEVIEKDIIFGSVLSKIKSLIMKNINEQVENLKSINKQLQTSQEEKSSFKKMLDRLSTENIDLGKEIQRLEAICSGLQSTLDDIRKVSVEATPINSDKWKALIYENHQYSSLVQDMKLDIREYQYKEDQLIRLIGAIKNRGVPVDDIYDEEVKTELGDSRVSESSEQLTQNRVPVLDLSQILTSSGELIR